MFSFADKPGRVSDELWRTVTTRAHTANPPPLLLSQRLADILRRNRPAAIHLSGRRRPARSWTEPFVCVHVWTSVKFWSGFFPGYTRGVCGAPFVLRHASHFYILSFFRFQPANDPQLCNTCSPWTCAAPLPRSASLSCSILRQTSDVSGTKQTILCY